MNRLICAVVVSLASGQPDGPAASEPVLLLDRCPEALRAVVVQHDGRWMPLDTLARDVVRGVTGTTRFQGRDPVLLLLAWTLESDRWRAAPLIRIASVELRRELGLPSDRLAFSFAELAGHQPLMKLAAEMERRQGPVRLNPLESKVNDIMERLETLHRVFAGEVIRPLPAGPDPQARWWTVDRPEQGQPRTPEAVTRAWDLLAAAFLSRDQAILDTAAGELKAALDALPAPFRPSERQMRIELLYNRLQPFRTGWIVLAVALLLWVVAAARPGRSADAAAMVASVGGFVVLTAGLAIRWRIAGRIPAANMYESLLFLAWGASLFVVLAAALRQNRFVSLTAALVGAVSLFLADVLPLDPFVRPIAPVLMDTVWMTIHVPGIMAAYAVLALAMLIAHAQMAVMALAPDRERLIAALAEAHLRYLRVGTLLLGAGIVTGSMWAASSWGRYWGWDPKEVWSLIAFLAYLTILHARLDHRLPPAGYLAAGAVLTLAVLAVVQGRLSEVEAARHWPFVAVPAVALFTVARGPFATAARSALAFWLVMMTYVGVNFVLGTGLHSYGFGTGAVARYLLGLGSADLLLVGALAGILAARRGVRAVLACPQQVLDPPARA